MSIAPSSISMLLIEKRVGESLLGFAASLSTMSLKLKRCASSRTMDNVGLTTLNASSTRARFHSDADEMSAVQREVLDRRRQQVRVQPHAADGGLAAELLGDLRLGDRLDDARCDEETDDSENDEKDGEADDRVACATQPHAAIEGQPSRHRCLLVMSEAV